MSVSLSTEYLIRLSDLPDEQSFTACGLAYQSSDPGEARALFVLSRISFSHYALLGLDTDGTTPYVESGGGLPDPDPVAFDSSPGIGSWFFWYLRGSGTGAGAIQAGWKYLRTGSWGGQKSVSGAAYNPQRIFLAGDTLGGPFPGSVQNFIVWGAVLTDAELLQQSLQLMPIRTENLRAWNPLFAHTALHDQSGNGRALVLGGSGSTAASAPQPWSTVHPTRVPSFHNQQRGVLLPQVSVLSSDIGAGILI